MNYPLLTIANIGKHFGGVVALKDVSFEVSKGEILGLIGPNGAGKTTLFNIIAGAASANHGSLTFNGHDIGKLRPDERCTLGIARTFQIPQPFAQMTVRNNIDVALKYRSRHDTTAPTADDLLTEFSLEAWASSEATGIPLGGKKRLEFARALATGPQLLLLDEVMGGLRPTEVTELMKTIRRVADTGITVIMIEHVMRAVMDLCERIIVLHHGELIASGTPCEISSNRKVVEAYLGASHAGT